MLIFQQIFELEPICLSFYILFRVFRLFGLLSVQYVSLMLFTFRFLRRFRAFLFHYGIFECSWIWRLLYFFGGSNTQGIVVSVYRRGVIVILLKNRILALIRDIFFDRVVMPIPVEIHSLEIHNINQKNDSCYNSTRKHEISYLVSCFFFINWSKLSWVVISDSSVLNIENFAPSSWHLFLSLEKLHELSAIMKLCV